MMERCAAPREPDVDARMLDACRQGDRNAMRRLYDAYRDRVYATALHFFRGDPDAAADATQEVFLKVFRGIGGFRREAEFTTWLYRMVANVCIDEHRRRKRVVTATETEGIEEMATQGDASESVERAVDVQAALSDLPPEIRVTILLRYFQELSYGEIARAMGCSSGTVGSRLSRGLRHLARRLGDGELGVGEGL